MEKKQIGVLAVQGAFAEHIAMVRKLGAEAFEIRQLPDLERPMDGLILPGGESTAMRKPHDLGAISKVADRILVMNSGQIVDSGDFEHIRNHANDPYTRLLIEKRSAVMCHYRDILHGKEISHA